MQQIPEHIDELIALSLAGEATVSQLQTLEQWKQEDPLNALYADQCATIFNTPLPNDQIAVDTDKAWKKVQLRIKSNNVIQLPESKVTTQWKQFLRIAAILLFIAGIGWWINYNYRPAELLTIHSSSTVLHDTLSDGSIITLNRNSSLTYTEDFGKKERRIKLHGEAFFNVKHDDKIPFIVEANGVFIKDIGTAFNVNAPNDSSLVKVFVEEGVIHFFVEGTEGLLLKRGEAAEYNATTKTIKRIEEMQQGEGAYRNGMLRFNNARLTEVAVAIGKLYGIPVLVESGLEDCLITVTFNNETLDTVLNIICETMNLHYDKNENTIYLRGTGCRK